MIKRYIATFLATVLLLNTAISSLGSVIYAEEQQDVDASIMYEANEIEEYMSELQQNETSGITVEETTETKQEEISIVSSEEISSIEENVSYELESDSVEYQSTNQETEVETQYSETETFESVEVTNEIEVISEIESIRETDTPTEEMKSIELDEDSHTKSNLVLNHSDLVLEIGDCDQLIASIDGKEINYQDILWKSEDEDIVYIEKGYVYAISPGRTTITAQIDKTDKTAFCEILVNGSIKRKAPSAYAASNSKYDASAAIQYAEAHWNDNKGLCAEFVSDCIKAGGISVYDASCTSLRGKLRSSNMVTEHTVSLNSGYLYKSSLSGKLEPGDIVMYYCSAETDGKPFVHAVLCNGFDSSGRMKAYAHNSAKNGKDAMIYSKCGYCSHAITTAYVFHFNGNDGQFQNINPIGYLDSIKVSDDSITIVGWARDDNDSNRAVEIVMEVGGNTYTTTARQYRGDVGSHGFDATFKVNCYGTQTVKVYMVDADTNQKFLIHDGERTVTIQRPYKIEYGISQVEFAYGGSQRISFSFQGDGISALDIVTGDGRIAQARFGDIDWNKGTGYVDISSGYAVGKTDLTIAFLDSNKNKVFRKSIPVKVTGEYEIKFDAHFNYVRENEAWNINFTMTGDGAAKLYYDISDDSIVTDLGWYQGGYNDATGKGSITIKGIKEGMTYLNVWVQDINDEVIYENSCIIRVMEKSDITFSDTKMKVGVDRSQSQIAKYKGYGVTDVTVECINPEIAEAAIKSNDKLKKEVEIVITGHQAGTATFLFSLWDATGKFTSSRILSVKIEESFDIQLDKSVYYLWKGQQTAIYHLIHNNYHGNFDITYELEGGGSNSVEITGHDGDENDGRQVYLKGLDSGMATLYFRIWGTGKDKDTLLYEESVFIMVFELKPLPKNKTAYIGETFQLDCYCEPATPTSLSLSYTSSDNTVASVDSNGFVTAKKKGKTTITITGTMSKYNQHSVTYELNVVEKIVNVTGITVSSPNKELTVGNTFSLQVSVQPANATDNKVSYSSSNTSVVTVDEYGRINAVGVGKAKITVTSNDGNKKAYCDIVVNPAIIASGKTGDLDWKIEGEEGDYTLTIGGIGAMADYSRLGTENEPEWYQYHTDLKHLVLEQGITKIGENAFSNCDSLSGELKLPSSLKTIGDSAFYGCSGFKGDIIIPDGTEQIENDAFRLCSGFDGNLSIPDSVAVISDSAFAGCSGLSGTLTLPGKLTCIEQYAFNGCRLLSGNLVLPEGLAKIESFAFQNCSGFTGDLVIPDSVSEISEGAFYNCTGFDGILQLPKNIKVVEANTFRNTRFSDMITIPSAVTKISGNAFYNIPMLRVYFEGDAPRSVKAKSDVSASFSEDVQIYYNPEKSGWSTPEWNEYAAEPVSEDTPINVPVKGIDLQLSGEYLTLGDSEVFQYQLIPENTTEKDVVWESSNISVATVDENGQVTAVGYGEAYITVSTKNGKYSESCEILVVKQPDPTLYIEFDETNPWMWVGETKTLEFRCGGRGYVDVGQAIYDPAVGEFIDWGETEYTTEGEGVHTQKHEERSMDITGVGQGKTNVAIRLYDGRSNLLYQKLTEIIVTDLQLSENYIEIEKGENYESLQASVYPEIGREVEVQYKSSDEAVVSVDQEGVLTAIKPGVAMIIVTTADGAVSKYCDVLVYDEGADDKDNEQLKVPLANLESGSSVEKGTKIVLSCAESGVDIYYTTDSSVPTKRSTIYTKPIEIIQDTTIKAFASKEGYRDSEIITLTYVVTKPDDDPEKPSEEESSEENSTEETPSDEESSEETSSDEESTKETPSDEPTQDEDDYPYTDTERQDLSSLGAVISNIRSTVYSRDEYEPAIKVTVLVNGKKLTLTEGMDYRVSYQNNINAGTATVTIKGNGEYKGSLTKNFTISPKSVKKLKVVTGALSENATGNDLSAFPIHVYDGTKRLNFGTDYTLSDAGTAKNAVKVTITGKGNYTGTVTAKLTLYNTSNDQIINPDNVRLNTDTAAYTGKAVKTVEPIVTINNATLVPNKDYKVQYKNNINAGTAYVIVTGKRTYKGKVVVPFTIKAADVSSSALTIKSIPAKTYNGKLQKPAVTVTVQNWGSTKKLVKNRDYKVTYKDNLHAGTATVVITGKGNYAGIQGQTQFTINPQKITKATVKGTQGKITLTYNRRTLKENTHYEPPIYGEIKKNKVKVIIKGKGDFTGETTKYVKQ